MRTKFTRIDRDTAESLWFMGLTVWGESATTPLWYCNCLKFEGYVTPETTGTRSYIEWSYEPGRCTYHDEIHIPAFWTRFYAKSETDNT